MKKAGIIVIAIALVAASVIFFNRSQANERKGFKESQRGTLVKEQIEWTKFYT